MKTEELNEYLFADLVHERAFRLWCQDCEKMEKEQGLSVDEVIAKMPGKDTFIPNAVAYLNEFRSKVFAAKKESQK